MTTKIQPANIDQSLDYTVDQLTANTVVAGGVDLYAFANAAFTSANAAGSSATVTAAYTQANTATNAVINIPSQFLLMGA